MFFFLKKKLKLKPKNPISSIVIETSRILACSLRDARMGMPMGWDGMDATCEVSISTSPR